MLLSNRKNSWAEQRSLYVVTYLTERDLRSHPDDASIRDDRPIPEEDEGVQLSRGPPCKLGVPVPCV